MGDQKILLNCGGFLPLDSVFDKYKQILPQHNQLIILSSAPAACGFLPFINKCGFTGRVRVPRPIFNAVRDQLRLMLEGYKTMTAGYRIEPVSTEEVNINQLDRKMIDDKLGGDCIQDEPGKILNLTETMNVMFIQQFGSCAVLFKHKHYKEEVMIGGPLLSIDYTGQQLNFGH